VVPKPLARLFAVSGKSPTIDVELVLPATALCLKTTAIEQNRLFNTTSTSQESKTPRSDTHAQLVRLPRGLRLGKEPSIFQLMAATFETLAHLHLLMYDDKVKRIEEKDKVTYSSRNSRSLREPCDTRSSTSKPA